MMRLRLGRMVFGVLVVGVGFLHDMGAARVMGELIPRTPLPKADSIVKHSTESRLTIKFTDGLKVRAVNGNLSSLAGANLTQVNAVTAQFALTFDQLIQLPQETLDRVESRAAERSGVAQPDLAGMMEVHGPDETLEQAAQALLALDELEWAQFGTPNGELPCADIAPATDDYFAERGIDPDIRDYHGPDPGLDMSCAWAYAARGQGIQIADCDGGYILGTEDLCDIVQDPDEPGHENQRDHGTAVLGVMVAMDNDYGWTGLVPDASALSFPVRTEAGVWIPEEAITAAIDAVGPGDIVVIEYSTILHLPGELYNGPGELDEAIWMLTDLATDSGIIVVSAAGNGGGTDLDDNECPDAPFCQYFRWGDSGAIIVGAGTADINHDRMSFSTFGQRVNVQGWGENVFTLGNDPNTENPDDIELGGDERQRYQHHFSGTSSATPFVASCVVALQSVAWAELGYKLTPVDMRQLLIDTGIPQGAGGHIGPFPDMAAALLQLGVAQDCNANGYPDLCDIASGVSVDCDANEIPDECSGCSYNCPCDDGDVCTFDCCENAVCSYIEVPYGDVAGGGFDCTGSCGASSVVDLDDILAITAAFGQMPPTGCLDDYDIAPCAGNGVVDLDDILAVVAAFGGTDPCCSGESQGAAPPPPSGPVAVEAELRDTGGSFVSGPIEVDLYVKSAADLRGYQVTVVVSGDIAAQVQLESLYIDASRADYVFAGAEAVTATDLNGWRFAAARMSGGASVTDRAYLGTCVLRVADGVSGMLQISLDAAGTMLRDSFGTPVEVTLLNPINLTLP